MSTEMLNSQLEREPRTLGRRAFIIGAATAVSAAATEETRAARRAPLPACALRSVRCYLPTPGVCAFQQIKSRLRIILLNARLLARLSLG